MSQLSFVEMIVKEHVTLLPSYLGKVGKGVIELLTSRVLSYHTLYNGVLLSFSRITVLHRSGEIHDELPHVHIDIEYSATIFRPQIGDVMCGEVNKVGVDHIGCLLMSCFNVSVTCSHLSHLSHVQQERRLRKWCENDFFTGHKIWFSVTSVDVSGKLLSLRGEYQIEKKEEEEEKEVVEKEKKEGEKKRQRTEEEREEQERGGGGGGGDEEEEKGAGELLKGKKRKGKKKRVEEEIEGEDEGGKVKKKERRKRKRQEESEGTTESDGGEVKKKKKRRRL